MTYNVFGGKLNLTQSINHTVVYSVLACITNVDNAAKWKRCT